MAASHTAVGLGAWFAHRPPPPVEQRSEEDIAVNKAANTTIEQHQQTGPVQIVTHTVTKYQQVPGPAICPPEPSETETTVTETRGPSSTTTDTTSRTTEQDRTKREAATIAAQALANYSVLVGAEVWPERNFATGGALRLPTLPIVGSLWVQGELTPKPSDLLHSNVVVFLRKDF